MSRSLQGGLIGCGFFAINHLHGWADARGADIVALCDRDPALLKLVGDQFGIARRYTGAAEMLEAEQLDFVDMATTVASHRPLVELAARSRVTVICQKPSARSMDDARAMVAASDAAGVPLMVHENFRLQSAIRAVKALIASGEIGDVFWGRVSFRSAYEVFSGQPYLAEGERFIIEDLGIHALDIARALFGDATSCVARTRRVNPAIKGEDVATMLLGHVGDVTSVVDCSYATIQTVEPLVEVDGTTGTIRLGQGYGMTVATRAGHRQVDVSPPVLPGRPAPGTTFRKAWPPSSSTGSNASPRPRDTETSRSDNLRTLALVEAAYRSASSGAVIDPGSL